MTLGQLLEHGSFIVNSYPELKGLDLCITFYPEHGVEHHIVDVLHVAEDEGGQRRLIFTHHKCRE
jgi:hypothetical protein